MNIKQIFTSTRCHFMLLIFLFFWTEQSILQRLRLFMLSRQSESHTHTHTHAHTHTHTVCECLLFSVVSLFCFSLFGLHYVEDIQ